MMSGYSSSSFLFLHRVLGSLFYLCSDDWFVSCGDLSFFFSFFLIVLDLCLDNSHGARSLPLGYSHLKRSVQSESNQTAFVHSTLH